MEGLKTRLDSLIAGEPDWLANISNACALLFQMLPHVNWAGFHLMKEGTLVPISQDGHIVAVLDLDSPSRNRFDETDASGLENFVAILLKHASFPF